MTQSALMLETLDFTICIVSTPTFFYFDKLIIAVDTDVYFAV